METQNRTVYFTYYIISTFYISGYIDYYILRSVTEYNAC